MEFNSGQFQFPQNDTSNEIKFSQRSLFFSGAPRPPSDERSFTAQPPMELWTLTSDTQLSCSTPVDGMRWDDFYPVFSFSSFPIPFPKVWSRETKKRETQQWTTSANEISFTGNYFISEIIRSLPRGTQHGSPLPGRPRRRPIPRRDKVNLTWTGILHVWCK